MKQAHYINGIGVVGAQKVLPRSNNFFAEINRFSTAFLSCQFTEYQTYIKKSAMRRMSSSVKMGSVAAKKALDDAKIIAPDGIVTGTGMGCKQDSDLFLENLLNQNEELLAPTKFIQSTHNTVGGQIALQLQSKVYNSTFVQGASSFEATLLDAQLSLSLESELTNMLVGGIDELSESSKIHNRLNGQIKQEKEVNNLTLLSYKTRGSIVGEGAVFFCISTEKNEESYAKIIDVQINNHIALENLSAKLKHFLEENFLTTEDIDLLILGNNGDSTDESFYNEFQQNFSSEIPQVYYKHLVGEFYTASSIATALGAHILKTQNIPESCFLNPKKPAKKSIQRILLYNQYQGRDHSFLILERC